MAFEQPEELGSAVELARPEQRTKPPGSFASELLNGTIHGQLGVEEYAEDLEIVPVGLALVKKVLLVKNVALTKGGGFEVTPPSFPFRGQR